MKHYFKIIKSEIVLLPQLLNFLFSTKKKALYVGCTGMGNLGDEAIFAALKDYLSKEVCIYSIPYNNVNAGKIARKFFIKKPDFIILGGGTIVKKGPKESYLKIMINQMSLYPDSKVVVLGPGVADADFAKENGDVVDTLGWKKFLDQASFVSVRGVLSINQLKKWNVEQELSIFHDPALFYAKEAIKPKSRTKKIGINFAFIGHKIYGKQPELIEKFANELVNLLIADNWDIHLYPTTVTDLNYMQNKIGLIRHENIKIYQDYVSIEKSLKFLESMDVFLGQRLHSIIFAACTYTPFHAIEYEPKTSDFLLTTGFEGYSTKSDELDASKVFKTIKNLYSNIDIEQEKAFQLVAFAKNEQEKCLEKMFFKK